MLCCLLCAGEMYLKEWSPPPSLPPPKRPPHRLSVQFWAVCSELWSSTYHVHWLMTATQKLLPKSWMLMCYILCCCTYHAHGHPADAGIQEACAGVGRHFALEIVGSLPWYAMVLYLFPAQKKKKQKCISITFTIWVSASSMATGDSL